MRARAYAAAHPDRAARLVLIGGGTFDAASRARVKGLLDERLTPQLRHRMEQALRTILRSE